jgi:(heptosyl)LPS beta-1,4-glucosyltransferase
MQKLSVVIVCKNEADIIGRTLQSLQGLTDDIVLYDNGSSDATMEIAKQFNVQLYQGNWEGYGKTKRTGISFAKYDWILNIDADETPDEELKRSLQTVELLNEKTVYEVAFKNFLGSKYLRYGEWGNDRHIRLFNRNEVNWDDAPVHEKLIMPTDVTKNKLDGYILHQTVKDMQDYTQKTKRYATLNAEKYYLQGKKASWFMLFVAPAFAFVKYYIFKLGFLDGQAGYTCAKMTTWYTFLKYEKLRELTKQVGDS